MIYVITKWGLTLKTDAVTKQDWHDQKDIPVIRP